MAQRKAAPVVSAEAARAAEPARAAMFSVGVDIDVTALLALAEQINNDLPDLHANLAHFVALAATKASATSLSAPLVMGLAANTESTVGEASLLAGADCRTLGGVVAKAKIAAATSAAAQHGTLWIERAQDGVSFLSADPPSGWPAALAIGALREAFRPDPEGRAVRAALVTVVLTARASALDPQQGQHLLRGLRQLLEAPLLLLA